MVSLAFTAWSLQWWICLGTAGAIAVGTGLHIIWPHLLNAKEHARDRRRMVPFVGMIACGLGTLGFGLWLFWPSTNHAPSQSAADSIPPSILPVASLRYNFANLKINYYRSTDIWTGQINVELVNETDHILHFVALTEGTINGMPFSEGKDTVKAIIYPHQSGWLLSRRISGFNENKNPSHSAPAFRAIFEYDLRYGYVEMDELVRRSARRIEIDQWDPLVDPGSGTGTETLPAEVRVYNELEQ